MTTVGELAERYVYLPPQLYAVLQQFPDAHVVRNQVGNLAILAADGTYIGYIDVLTGEVNLG